MVKYTSFKVPNKDGTVWKINVSGICLFLYEVEQWNKKVPTENFKTQSGKTKLNNKMYSLHGNKTSEQFMLLLKNYDDKISNNLSLSAAEKLETLKQIAYNQAQFIVSKVKSNFY